MGRKGLVAELFNQMGLISKEERPQFGKELNKLKVEFIEKIDGLGLNVKDPLEKTSDIDLTLPGDPFSIGSIHPLTQLLDEIKMIFTRIGFSIFQSPEIDTEFYNFEALNIPKYHPARDMWDTLWVTTDQDSNNIPMLLRTHTSPVQVRIMESENPPIRIISPGKCYRYEATDSTHEWHFHQVEGLAVDEGITFADLKGTLYEFARRLFGEDRKIRFRCDYFPFVEPGVDMSIDCFACDGSSQSCRICRGSGWIEIMGAGMVHPEVLKGVGYDPEKYTGFAFGLGPERIAMLKHGIDDIRHFYTNDLRFLRQF